MANWRTCFPVIGARKDEGGEYITTPVEETVQVLDAYARLSQVPALNAAAQIKVRIDGYAEVFAYPTLPDTFMVNYATGRVYFHESQEGAFVNAKYEGQGSLVAVDEINWLWEQLVGQYRSDYFVQLMDTPDVLVPGAYMRADKSGSRLENAAATVGRDFGRTIHLPNFSGETRVPGSVFNTLVMYTATDTVRATDEYTLTTKPTGTDVVLNAGTWGLAAGKSQGLVTVGDKLDTGKYTAISGFSFKAYSMQAGKSEIRVLMIIDGQYYTYGAGGWMYRSDTLPTISEILTLGNLPHELDSINPKDTKYLLGRTVSYCAVLKAFGHSPTLSGTVVVNGHTGGGFTVAHDWGAAFDTASNEWVVTGRVGAPYMLAVGSGHDDVACTCDAIDFKDVRAGESVTVSAPVRTMVNVLKFVPTASGQANFPTKGPGWTAVKSPVAVPIEREFYPYVTAGFNTEFQSHTALFKDIPFEGEGSAFCSFSEFPTINSAASPPAAFPTGTREPQPFAGMFGTSGQFNHENNAVVRLDDPEPVNTEGYPPLYGNPNVFTARAFCTAGGWFKWVAGEPVVMSNNTVDYYGILRVILLDGIVRVTVGGTVEEYEYPKGEWVHLVLSDFNVTRVFAVCGASVGYVNCELVVKVCVNGVVDTCVGSANYGCDRGWSVANAPFTGPVFIGDSVNDIPENTEFLCEQAFCTRRSMFEYNMSKLYNRSMEQVNMHKSASRAVYHASVDNFPSAGSVPTFDTMYIPDNWKRHPQEFLFAFFDGEAYYTIHPTTFKVIGIGVAQNYAQLRGSVASIATLRAAKTVLATGRFDGMKLVVISNDKAGKNFGWAFPSTLNIASSGSGGEWQLVKPADADVSYTGTGWSVTNKAGTADFKIVVLGGTIPPESALHFFTSLKDCPATLADPNPKVLVSHDGIVTKRMFLHPYMRGDI